MTLDSPLAPAEVLAAFRENVESWKWFRGPKTFFGGTVEGDSFVIAPVVLRGRNSFVPVIFGKVEARGSGSRVLITMRLHRSVALVCLGFILVFLTMAGVSASRGEWVGVCVPLAMLIFLFVACFHGFWSEVGRSRIKILGLLSGA